MKNSSANAGIFKESISMSSYNIIRTPGRTQLTDQLTKYEAGSDRMRQDFMSGQVDYASLSSFNH